MTRVCSMAWNSIMTNSWRLGHLVMFSQRCFFRRTTLSPLSKAGHFLGKSTSMVMSACCPYLRHIHFCPTLHIKTYLLSQPSFLRWFSCWSLFGDCLDCFPRVRNAETVIQVLKPRRRPHGTLAHCLKNPLKKTIKLRYIYIYIYELGSRERLDLNSNEITVNF